MEFDVLTRSVFSAIDGYRRDTNLDPKVEWLEIRIHPDDYAGLIGSAPKWLNAEELFKRATLGIPIVHDPSVAIGHPEVRSTWKWVL